MGIAVVDFNREISQRDYLGHTWSWLKEKSRLMDIVPSGHDARSGEDTTEGCQFPSHGIHQSSW